VNRPNEAPETSTRVRGLALPTLLIELLTTGQWRHPGDETLRKIMPWFEDPLVFLPDVDQIRRESGSLFQLTDDEGTGRLFRLSRGSADPVELPYLDVDLAVLVAVNRIPGDDVAVALDYRTRTTDPRVVASDLWTDPRQCSWRTVAPTFSAFIAALNLTRPQHFNYVGPAEILDQVQPGSHGRAITSRADLAAWLDEQTEHEREEPFTFIVDLNGTLRLAPQRSEHVACAGGDPVLSAGEITFARQQDDWLVREISNQSTGYCPDVTSWAAVETSLDRAGLDHPHTFTNPIVFRRCPQCRQRNIVKDGDFACAVCDAPLPSAWNIDRADGDAAEGGRDQDVRAPSEDRSL
jgi:hypothetical protein